MSRHFGLFVMLLAVPLVAWGVSEGIQLYSDSQLRSAILRQVSDADPVKVATVTMDLFCARNIRGTEQMCEEHQWLNLMSAAALGSGAAGLLLILGIWGAGRIARDNRSLLLRLFKPGLYVTGVVLIGLVITHAALAMAALYLGESTLFHRVHVGIIFGIGLGAAYGVYAIATNTFSLVRTIRTMVFGKTLSRTEVPELWKRVDEIADRLGALRPDHIVVGLDPNFFVTESEVVCLTGTAGGRILYCSLPLMRLLSQPEFEGIIGHELGHFKGQDTEFSQRFYPIYRGTAGALAGLEEASAGSRSIALLPAIAIFGYFLECFSVAEQKIGRDREIVADREGASVSGAAAFASALVKVHAYTGIWGAFEKAAVEAVQQKQVYVNASKTYHKAVCQYATASALEGLATTRVSHPTDSHPPLAVRLDSLLQPIESVHEKALVVSPEYPATALVRDAEKLEEGITVAYHSLIAHRLGISLASREEPAPAAGV